MRTLACDIETFSSAELSETGVYRYTEAPDFQILLLGYKWDDEPDVSVIDLTSTADFTPEEQEVIIALTNPNVRKTAWNAAFERTCLAKWLNRPMPPEQWDDTMVRALELGLPGSLAGAGIALGLPAEKLKDPRGKALINFFSKPCKPTKANNGRTRNLPAHDPDKWNLYIEYNRQDVVTEQAIREMLLKKVQPIQSEWDLWYLDQRMNDYGVRIDLPMVNKIVAYDAERQVQLINEAKDITGLENPNSLIQLKDWLTRKGVPLAEVTKDVVIDQLKKVDLPPEVRRVLEIRQALGKSSVKKFHTMLDAACADGRIRGTMQFYGAARTGRFAGRLVQVHNLSKNYLPDLDLARQLVCEGRFDDLELLFGEPAFVFSELVRTAFIPSKDRQFVVADFSAIEARVLGWLAGEEWVLEAFRNGKDIYCETASKMYHVPVVKHGQNGHLRAKGKVATLACIAEGQLVLTDQGEIQIEKVTTDMKVWDGEEWVTHDGVIYRGEREVITYDGLTATPDHLVWVEGKPEPVQFGIASASGAHLLQTGDGGVPIRMGENHQPGETLGQRVEPMLRFDEMPGMRSRAMAAPVQSDTGEIKGMPELHTTETNPQMAGQKAYSSKTEMHEPRRSAVQALRRQRNPVRFSERDGSRTVFNPNLRDSGPKFRNRPDRQQRELCSRKHPVCDTETELRQSANNSSESVRSRELAVCGNGSQKNAVFGDEQRRNYCVGGNSGSRTQETLENHSRTSRLYDIRNAGRHHRFTVSGKLVHNCGYQGGVGAMKRMDKGGSIPEEELQSVVDQWRSANPHIVKFWRDCENAAKTAIREKRSVRRGIRLQIDPEEIRVREYAAQSWVRPYSVRENCSIFFTYRDKNLYIKLPSGRSICYWNARLKEDPTGKESIVFMSVNTARQWAEEETYGGKITENITQAVARDCLAETIRNVSAMGYEIVMHVHDEIIVDAPVSDTSAYQNILETMKSPIPWAPGLPLNADGYVCDYYRKD